MKREDIIPALMDNPRDSQYEGDFFTGLFNVVLSLVFAIGIPLLIGSQIWIHFHH